MKLSASALSSWLMRRKTKRPMADSVTILTLWALPDDLWQRIERLLNRFDPPRPRGRKRASARPILDGLIYHFRTGCQWNQIPEVYGDDSTIHRTFQRWIKIGLFEMIWSLLLAECDQLGLVDWQWQAADGSVGKARNGGDQIGPNPADRAKQWSKKKSARRRPRRAASDRCRSGQRQRPFPAKGDNRGDRGQAPAADRERTSAFVSGCRLRQSDES